MPIVYNRESVVQLEGKTPTKTKYTLRFLELGSVNGEAIFDIESAKVCDEPLVKDQRKHLVKTYL